jgi:hypothetical protein
VSHFSTIGDYVLTSSSVVASKMLQRIPVSTEYSLKTQRNRTPIHGTWRPVSML